MFPRWEDRQHDFDAMPGRFRSAGYRTAVVSDYAGDIFGRIDLGFQTVDTPRFDLRELVRQRALERETPLLPFLHSRVGRSLFPVLREMNHAADPEMLAADVGRAIDGFGKAPFFLTVFFSTAHFPYAAPNPYYGAYTDPAYRGRYKYHKPVGLGDEAPPDVADIRQIRGLYDGAVRSIDDAMAEVIDRLASRGLLDDTVVVVTADHGETLYENNHGQGHGDHLFGDEGTHTPLIIFDPRSREHHHESGVVRDVDLAPTIYDLVGLPRADRLDGATLAPVFSGKPLDKRTAFAETELWFTEDIQAVSPEMRFPYPGVMHLTELDGDHGDEIVLRKQWEPLTTMARHRMARDERFKLVYVPTRTGAKYMLFDTKEDPGENRNVAASYPKEVESLRGQLMRWMLADPRAELVDGLVVPRGSR
jgi:arylsulfatase A-like enzyme